MTAPETIYALSSGRPPAAIAIVRISGPAAGATLDRLAALRPAPRRATAVDLHDPQNGELLDRALVLWLPGPKTATGEDLAELHLHGGRAVIDGVLRTLERQPALRSAQTGEFTRRAFENGRIDLNEAEGLADLLVAETQSQRRAALLASGGALSRHIADWQSRLLAISAAMEAVIDYSDEDDVGAVIDTDSDLVLKQIAKEMEAVLARPSVERLRDGVRIVVAGPPNSGKSSLINALSGRDAAIASPRAGTTRDLIEVPLSLGGLPVILVDTAGLRETEDEVEVIGVGRAQGAIASSDLVIWLGDEVFSGGDHALNIQPFADLGRTHPDRISVSSLTGENIDVLIEELKTRAAALLPLEGEVALNRRQRGLFHRIVDHLHGAIDIENPLIVADELRASLRLCDELTGRAGVEDMLDTLFGRFCIGK